MLPKVIWTDFDSVLAYAKFLARDAKPVITIVKYDSRPNYNIRFLANLEREQKEGAHLVWRSDLS